MSKCDQIWRNFLALAKILSLWQNIISIYLVHGQNLNPFGTNIYAIGQISLL